MTLPLLRVAELGEEDETLANVQFNFDQIAKQFLDTGGQSLKMRVGTATATFSASPTSATKTVNHGLGSTPVAVFITPSSTGVAWAVPHVGAFTSTSFGVVLRDADAVNRTGDHSFYWLAVG